MPLYEYRNKKTGKVWTEHYSIADRLKPLKDKNIELVISAPATLTRVNSGENKIRDNIQSSYERGYAERDALEKAGKIKVPNHVKERREKSKQKRSWL